MSIWTRILCPTDFSETSAKATSYAEQLARELDAELILIHAFDPPANWTLAGQEHPRDPRIEQELGAVLAGSSHSTKIKRLLHAGDPGQVISWIAQEHKCDLIIMGTHGRTGMKHLLFGSVAEYVLQHARCPVLCIRDREPNEMPLARPLNLPVIAPRFM